MDTPIKPPPPTRILLAVAEDARPRMERVLKGHDMVAVRDTAQAEQALLREDFGLIVIGVNFDESRMFELLAYIRAQERHKAKPVMCVLGPGGRASAMAVEAIDRAAKAMLANAFLWLEKFPEDPDGDRRIRRIADYLILIDGDMHHGVKQA